MRIIHGTDFTENAALAGRVAAAMVARIDDTWMRVHSLEAGGLGAISSGAQAKALAGMAAYLEKSAERLREQGAMVKTELLTGAADEATVKMAAPGGTRLVVVGSLGWRAVVRWRLGSVSERVVETSGVPTWVVRQEEALVAWARHARPLKIVCAYDFTSTADAALASLKQSRRIGTCEIVWLQVDWPVGEKMRLGVTGPGTTVANLPEVQAILVRDLHAKVTSVLGETGVRVRVEASLGPPDFRLIEIARKEQADLVVTGTHQRHGWSRLWHDSTSRGLLHYAPMSVLVVPLKSGPVEPSVPPVRRVLVTTDFSELGNQASPHAYCILKSGGRVRLLPVKSPASPTIPAMGEIRQGQRPSSRPSLQRVKTVGSVPKSELPNTANPQRLSARRRSVSARTSFASARMDGRGLPPPSSARWRMAWCPKRAPAAGRAPAGVVTRHAAQSQLHHDLAGTL